MDPHLFDVVRLEKKLFHSLRLRPLEYGLEPYALNFVSLIGDYEDSDPIFPQGGARNRGADS